MKRILFRSLLAFEIFLLSTHLSYANPQLIAPLNFHNSIQSLHTPKEIVRFMKKNFEFKDDMPQFGEADYWQTPEEFWERKSGDCEDFALFAKYVFDQKGIESYVVSFYGDNQFAHTVAVYKEKDRFNVINEERLHKYKTKSIEEALSRVYPAWRWGGIAEQRGTRGWMVKRLTNPDYQPFESFASETFDFPEYFF